MSAYSFKGTSNIGDYSLGEVVEEGVISFIDWGFMEKGAYFNISIPSSGAYGGNRHVLRPVDDPRYTAGQVWEAYRGNWVWQSGMSCSPSPISISGVFVNNAFVPKSGGTYAVNYAEGRVIFNTAIAVTSTVKLEYTHKWVSVVNANEIPWFREGHSLSFRLDESDFVAGSGIWNKLESTTIELPAVAVELVGKTYEGYQLGGGHWVYPELLLHVLAEDNSTAKRIANILSEQTHKTIYLYDFGRMATNNAFPLNYQGDTVTGALSYPDLVSSGVGGYRYTTDISEGKLFIAETSEQNHGKILNNVYHSTVRWKTDVISRF